MLDAEKREWLGGSEQFFAEVEEALLRHRDAVHTLDLLLQLLNRTARPHAALRRATHQRLHVHRHTSFKKMSGARIWC